MLMIMYTHVLLMLKKKKEHDFLYDYLNIMFENVFWGRVKCLTQPANRITTATVGREQHIKYHPHTVVECTK